MTTEDLATDQSAYDVLYDGKYVLTPGGRRSATALEKQQAARIAELERALNEAIEYVALDSEMPTFWSDWKRVLGSAAHEPVAAHCEHMYVAKAGSDIGTGVCIKCGALEPPEYEALAKAGDILAHERTPTMVSEPIASVCIDFPLVRGTYLAQLVLPRALCKQDAQRLIELIKCWPQTREDDLPMGTTTTQSVSDG